MNQFWSVRAASVGENAVDSAVNHGGLPHSEKVVESTLTAGFES
jgi:hypothetical protein